MNALDSDPQPKPNEDAARRRRVRVRTAACAAAGAVFALAAPPVDAVPALWIGMAALAWALAEDPELPPFASRARVMLVGARRALAFGFGANVVALRFVPGVIAGFTPLPWAAGALALALLAAFEGLRWMAAGVACETLVRARVPRSIAFAAGVYAGTFVPTVFPWTAAGGATPWPVTVQLAEVVGERGVAALMALVAALVAGAARARSVRAIGAAAAILAAQVVYGAVRMRAIDRDRAAAAHVRVALVQPSIGASTRWEESRAPSIVETLSSLTRGAESRGAEVVVWPEASYPYRLPHGTRRAAIVPAGVRAPIIAGLLTSGAEGGAAYNSVVSAAPDGVLSDSYDKRHLLWFGETVPFADRSAWMRRTFARGLGLAPGNREVALVAGRVRAAALVCYEDTLPDAALDAASVNPNLLVNVTNDAWFSGSGEGELHLRLSALRAVELRRDLVRAVNLGPTSWIDATGRVRARAPSDFATTLLAEPALLESRATLYARFGDVPWAIAALLLANAAVWRRAGARAKPAGTRR